MRTIGEGNANILIEAPQDGLVWRISKRGVDPGVVVKYWDDQWRPVLGNYLPPLKVVSTPEYGNVLEMPRIGHPPARILGELKPKWLIQSIDAPSGARQCRTCAIGMLRNKAKGWCPLDLACLQNLDVILECEDFQEIHKCVQYFHGVDLIGLLMQCQQNLSTSMVDASYPPSSKLLNLMSIRDCTIIIEQLPDNTIQGKVVDLDPKSPCKLKTWQAVERQLQPLYLQPNPQCRLSRTA